MKKKIFLPLLLILALALTACTPDDGNVDPDPGTPPVEDPTSDDDAPDKQEPDEETSNSTSGNVEYGDIKLTPSQAFDAYVEKYPNTKVKEVELDTDYKSYVYKVKGYDDDKEYKLYIDPVDGSIIKEKEERDDDDKNTEITRSHTDKIQALVDQALEDAGENAILDEWSLEVEDGIVELEVEIDFTNGDDDIEYKYNVESGELIKIDS